VPFQHFDASAIVKRYVAEAGSGWVRACTDPAFGNIISIAEVTRVEVTSALARRVRDGSLTPVESDSLIRSLEAHCLTQYRVIPTDRAVVGRAMEMARQRPLRAYDAVQLATALHLKEILVSHGLPALVFVSADNGLLAAAQAEGLTVENPNDHP
jgi:predicted nucleic acid-binding protein